MEMSARLATRAPPHQVSRGTWPGGGLERKKWRVPPLVTGTDSSLFIQRIPLHTPETLLVPRNTTQAGRGEQRWHRVRAGSQAAMWRMGLWGAPGWLAGDRGRAHALQHHWLDPPPPQPIAGPTNALQKIYLHSSRERKGGGAFPRKGTSNGTHPYKLFHSPLMAAAYVSPWVWSARLIRIHFGLPQLVTPRFR